MPLVTFKPSGKIVDVPAYSSLLDAAKKADISVEIPCGGNGVCGKCLVKIDSGAVDFENNGLLDEQMLSEGLVLICKTKIKSEPVSVDIISDLANERGKFSKTLEDMQLIQKDLLPTRDDLDPIVKKTVLTVSEPMMGDGLSDYDRLRKSVLTAHSGQDIRLPMELLATLPDVLRQTGGEVTLSYYRNYDIISVVDIETGNTLSAHYGIAVDIGTTTIAVQLVDMNTSAIIASKTDYNAQIECGLDVISRINYAKKPQRLAELRAKVLETINRLLQELSASHAIAQTAIINASVAGNTTMVHLLLGIIPEYIRLEPYTPAVYQVPLYTAKEIGIEINPNAPIYIAPSVGSYVGGDITSGILCTSLATASDEVCLFIDIGTNGELILGNHEFLLGCACSAGPAFEGGGIDSGMRASRGAIENVDINKETGLPTYSVIGGVAPIGICGSGMISLIASLFKTGWIDAAGRLESVRPCAAIVPNGKYKKYVIATSEETGGKPIYITEIDIDNLVRAKAAIYSACRVMLQNVNMDFEDLTRIYIAGGFGRYLDIDKSITIGLIPDIAPNKFFFVGNTSIIGAYMTLLSQKHREKQTELAQKITYLDLSTEPGYMDQYTAALFIPHTDSKLFRRDK